MRPDHQTTVVQWNRKHCVICINCGARIICQLLNSVLFCVTFSFQFVQHPATLYVVYDWFGYLYIRDTQMTMHNVRMIGKNMDLSLVNKTYNICLSSTFYKEKFNF